MFYKNRKFFELKETNTNEKKKTLKGLELSSNETRVSFC